MHAFLQLFDAYEFCEFTIRHKSMYLYVNED